MHSMSRTITISLDEETDQKLRRYAENKYGKKKGAIKKVLEEAMDSLIKKDKRENKGRSDEITGERHKDQKQLEIQQGRAS